MAMQKVEQWRQIANWPYDVSDRGRVRSWRTEKILVPMRCGQKRKQYSVVRLCEDGRWCDFKVHILVLEAFIGPRPHGLLGLHGDDDTNNNTLDNLYWGTPTSNQFDAATNGHLLLTKHQAAELAARRRAGERGADLAREYGVSQQTVCDIYKGRALTYEVYQ